ncbi:Dynein light domain containing protein [Asbolus verrucosus]|uniref:Dynein light chain n=2 Tax=Asbolus verrucosus TaxID=1661398 RepID=A0A482VJZ0_ASBVE|nr:Dynein light domain containing protein [Asbolus verrucosus]
MTDSKVVIKKLEMSEDMQQDAVDCATQAIEKHIIEKVSAAQRDGHVTDVPDHVTDVSLLQDIAAYIKKEFDKKYNPTWHCIVGRNYGSYVTHKTNHFIYFYLGQVAILLFKSG